MRETRVFDRAGFDRSAFLQQLEKEGVEMVSSFYSHSENSYSDSFRDLICFGTADIRSGILPPKEWFAGLIPYDYKNETERLFSTNPDFSSMGAMHFIVPECVMELLADQLIIHKLPASGISWDQLDQWISSSPEDVFRNPLVKVIPRISKDQYLEKVKKIKEHISKGDIYEMNFCMEFYAENADINPLILFEKLNKSARSPFAVYYKNKNSYLMCASPERFLGLRGNHLFSSPIKGTIRRGKDESEDEKLKSRLCNDPKERSENVMIVDIVRNDLSRVAEKGSVKVEELFGIHTFPTVHQMISVIGCEVKGKTGLDQILKATFPMGSMTGAPKIRAMQLIDDYEVTSRGWYSGSIGYILPNGNFDFNVIIRSILYNRQNKYLSFSVGSAITSASDPEKEYSECMLKAEALINALH